MAENVTDALSRVSGLSKEKIHEIWLKVKANQTKLDSCSKHSFTIQAGRREFMDDFICEYCGGRIDSTNKAWYEKGIKHAKIE